MRPGLLGVDLGDGLLAQPLDLVTGLGDPGRALLGGLLGTGQDVVRLSACLGRGSSALVSRGLAVAARLLGVLEPLLDPRPCDRSMPRPA